MDILQFTAGTKYIEFALHKLSTESDNCSVKDIKEAFKSKFKTEMPYLGNQYFGLMRLLSLLFIREENVSELKNILGETLTEEVVIIRHALAHNKIECDENRYTFRCEKGRIKKSIEMSIEELSDFCTKIEQKYFFSPKLKNKS